jgi:AMMECR1 domain-containing protein
MLVKGYVSTGFRALWWHLSDEIYEEYKVKPNAKISGTLHKVYKGAGKLKDAGVTHEPNVPFDWVLSKESGLAVLIPPKVIVEYKLTEFHFLELTIDKINDQEIWPGKDVTSVKMWPEDRMELPFCLDFIAP